MFRCGARVDSSEIWCISRTAIPSAPVSRTIDLSALGGTSSAAPVATLLGCHLHEGLCPGRRRHPPFAGVRSSSSRGLGSMNIPG